VGTKSGTSIRVLVPADVYSRNTINATLRTAGKPEIDWQIPDL
jgi:hypothetical protein